MLNATQNTVLRIAFTAAGEAVRECLGVRPIAGVCLTNPGHEAKILLTLLDILGVKYEFVQLYEPGCGIIRDGRMTSGFDNISQFNLLEMLHYNLADVTANACYLHTYRFETVGAGLPLVLTDNSLLFRAKSVQFARQQSQVEFELQLIRAFDDLSWVMVCVTFAILLALYEYCRLTKSKLQSTVYLICSFYLALICLFFCALFKSVYIGRMRQRQSFTYDELKNGFETGTFRLIGRKVHNTIPEALDGAMRVSYDKFGLLVVSRNQLLRTIVTNENIRYATMTDSLYVTGIDEISKYGHYLESFSIEPGKKWISYLYRENDRHLRLLLAPLIQWIHTAYENVMGKVERRTFCTPTEPLADVQNEAISLNSIKPLLLHIVYASMMNVYFLVVEANYGRIWWFVKSIFVFRVNYSLGGVRRRTLGMAVVQTVINGKSSPANEDEEC